MRTNKTRQCFLILIFDFVKSVGRSVTADRNLADSENEIVQEQALDLCCFHGYVNYKLTK